VSQRDADKDEREVFKRRMSSTHRMNQRPEFEELPKDRCMLTMLTGPTPGFIKTLMSGELVIGRDEDLPWPIEDRGVSGRHARIAFRDGAYVIADLDSTNGTYVNGRRIAGTHRLHDGDRLQLGENTLIRISLQDETEQQAARRMYEAAVRDPLTGLYNRGHLEATLESEFAFAQRHKTPLSVVFVDLDHFTEVNNRHGHQAGDAILRAAAHTMANAIRTEDLVARYGGEEFVILARGIDLNGALVMAERVRRVLELMVLPYRSKELRVTASFGVACFEAATPFETVERLVAAADRAVYRAKAEGRNRVNAALDDSADSWRAPDSQRPE
jgi:diguanylate cyclase (GGDEF)-like protein